jgi:hypothetical protein
MPDFCGSCLTSFKGRQLHGVDATRRRCTSLRSLRQTREPRPITETVVDRFGRGFARVGAALRSAMEPTMSSHSCVRDTTAGGSAIPPGTSGAHGRAVDAERCKIGGGSGGFEPPDGAWLRPRWAESCNETGFVLARVRLTSLGSWVRKVDFVVGNPESDSCRTSLSSESRWLCSGVARFASSRYACCTREYDQSRIAWRWSRSGV